MRTSLTIAALLWATAVQAGGITADPGTECQWSVEQRTGPCQSEPQFDIKTTYLDMSTPAPAQPRTDLFPEYNIREACATVGPAAAPYCEARSFAARDELVRLWPELSAEERRQCSSRQAPPHARFVEIVGCAQARVNVHWEQRMKSAGY